MSAATVWDDRRCHLGEGPLWHPLREQLFWFDILGRRLLSRDGTGPRHWDLGEHASAAGWIDAHRILVASETALFRLDLETGARTDLCALEPDRPGNRSNDGRADPWGGFWIGTMGKAAEPGAGAIYRYFEGELRRLFAGLTIPNALSFSPDRRFAHFADTAAGRVMRVALDPEGWPRTEPQNFLDFGGHGPGPDGAVCDAEGRLWLALWGGGAVVAYAPDGQAVDRVDLPASQPTCPAFGGPEYRTLFCTSATQGMDAAACAGEPDAGRTFAAFPTAAGLPEPAVIAAGNRPLRSGR